jgi:putative two-component system response regulator
MAKSGVQALQICSQCLPDLVLLDIEMPEMDGFAVINQLKNTPMLVRIPVIFLTATHDTATEVRALKSGAVDFIAKPVEKNILFHRIQLHLNMARYQNDLENTVRALEDSIVLSFSEMIENRDKNTGDHLQRAQNFVLLLGKELIRRGRFSEELNEQELLLIARGALLHDIGKIGISDTILLKPDRLDDEEFSIMKTHTTIGAKILQTMYERTPTQHYLKYAIKIAESHHEKYNGSGYPHRLRENEIPLCSRIMAVADVYDALVADRIYRKALNFQEALKLVASGKSTHFDPVIIEAFLAIQDKIEEVAKRSASKGGNSP